MGLFSDMVALSKTVFASETNFSSSQLLDGRELPIPNHKFYWHWNFFETPQKLINYCHQLTDDFATSGNWRPTPSFSLARSWFESLGWVTTQAMASKTGKLAKILFSIFFYFRNEQAATKGLPYWATESRVWWPGWASGEPSQAEAKNFGATLIPRILLVLKFAPSKSQSPQVGLQENYSELEGEEEKNA